MVLGSNVFRPDEGQPLVIQLKAPQNGLVTVQCYNLAGELVRPVFQAEVQAGLRFQAAWDGKNDQAEIVSSGVYFVSVKGAGIRMIRKVVVLR